jgi:hypothetical protein
MEMETDEDMEIPGLMNQPTDCWEKWHEQRTDAQRISHVRETSHRNATSKSQASNKQEPFSLLSTNLVRQQ